jgi:hypothetical protein
MNEQLIGNLFAEAQRQMTGSSSKEFSEKFAELIVRECMNVLDPGEHQLIARFQARKWLAEHFGVKE